IASTARCWLFSPPCRSSVSFRDADGCAPRAWFEIARQTRYLPPRVSWHADCLNLSVGRGARAPGRAEGSRGDDGFMETILLVDDDANVRSISREVRETTGYRVLDGADATEPCRAEAATTGTIDLLLTDVMMPGLSGPDLARRLRPRRPRMKVIYMT